MSETTQQLAADLIAAWNAHDVEQVAAFYAPDYEGVDVAQPASRRGLDAVRNTLTRYLCAFPDLHFTPDEIVAQDNQAAVAWTARGTHQGVLMNIPPTGRAIQVRGVSFFTVRDGKIIRALHIWDVAGLLRAIGLLPEL